MRILLDTHAFLWYITDNPKLSSKAKSAISYGDSQVFVSKASLWEIAIKVGKGKLKLDGPYEDYIEQQISFNRFTPLNIEYKHLNKLLLLEDHHHDPFDRLLIAQAVSENMPLITVDEKIAKYELDIIW